MWFMELWHIRFQNIFSGDWVFFTEENLNVCYYGQNCQELYQLRWRRPWDCMQDNTGSLDRVSYFVLENSVKFIILERTNGRNVISWFPLSWRKKSWRNGGNPVWWERRLLGVVDELHAPTGRVLRLWGIGLAVWFCGRIPVAGHQFRHHQHLEAQTWSFAVFLANITTFAQVVEAASAEVTGATGRLALLATPVAAQSHRPRAHAPQHHTWSNSNRERCWMFGAELRCNNGRNWEVDSQLWQTPVIVAYVTVHCVHAPFVGSFLGLVLITTSIWTCTPLPSAAPLC